MRTIILLHRAVDNGEAFLSVTGEPRSVQPAQHIGRYRMYCEYLHLPNLVFYLLIILNLFCSKTFENLHENISFHTSVHQYKYNKCRISDYSAPAAWNGKPVKSRGKFICYKK